MTWFIRSHADKHPKITVIQEHAYESGMNRTGHDTGAVRLVLCVVTQTSAAFFRAVRRNGLKLIWNPRLPSTL
ncbi:hypothetical protein BH11VER1_BH11VER1_32030 [soil metagenome]